MPRHTRDFQFLSRRSLLKGLGTVPLLLRSSPLHGYSFLFGAPELSPDADLPLHLSDVRLVPHYPKKSDLEEVLRLVPPGSDEYVTEEYAFAIQAVLDGWSGALRASARNQATLAAMLGPAIQAASLEAADTTVRNSQGLQIVRRTFAGAPSVHLRRG